MESCGNVPLHDLGSKYIADLEQHTITAQRTLDSFKEKMSHFDIFDMHNNTLCWSVEFLRMGLAQS